MKIVLNDLLEYSDLKIYQNIDDFCFSLDSVLLANFVTIKLKTKEIIDLGTGNAPIPLILSTKTKAHITGIELKQSTANLALNSIKYNHLETQITIVNENIKNLNKLFSPDSFDVVVVNPPYFKNCLQNEQQLKVISRHEYTINFDEILTQAKFLLKNNGYFATINRTNRFIEIISKMLDNNIEPKRVKFIYPNVNKASNLFLIEGVKNGKSGLKLEKPLYIHNKNGSYKKVVQKIFK